MTYSDGRQAALGDRVRLWDCVLGTIMCSLDDDRFSEEFSREHWAHLGKGVIIKADNGQVFHYEEADEDFELLSRAGERLADRI
jgi:hypothetical protein